MLYSTNFSLGTRSASCAQKRAEIFHIIVGKIVKFQTGFQPDGKFLQLVDRNLPTGSLESVTLFN